MFVPTPREGWRTIENPMVELGKEESERIVNEYLLSHGMSIEDFSKKFRLHLEDGREHKISVKVRVGDTNYESTRYTFYLDEKPDVNREPFLTTDGRFFEIKNRDERLQK